MTKGITWFPMTTTQAQAVQAAYAQEHQLPLTAWLDLGQGVTLDLVLIPPGEFIMGLPSSTKERYEAWEPPDTYGLSTPYPPHRVQISRPFYMAKYAITQGQWQAVMGENPAHFKGTPDLPMETVSWDACIVFCQEASAITGHQVRLPSEAEWEYACRAGSPTLFYFGDSRDELSSYAWYKDNAERRSHPVGRKQPNAWGLYDMHGGIDEFCQDAWHETYDGAPSDSSAWIQGGDPNHRVKRGGSWYDFAKHCCSPHRTWYQRDVPSEDHGLRVVVEVPQAG